MARKAQGTGKKRAIIYTRVSRVGKRGGDSFIAPEIQYDACEAKAKAEGYEVIDHIHEEDVSGGDDKRRGYNKAIGMIEAGQAEAIIIFNIWRFSRSAVEGGRDIDRITKAGGDLLSCANDIGDNTSTGRFQRQVFLAMGQMYREQAAEGFDVAQQRAVENAIWTASGIPFGYRKNVETKRLDIHEPEAKLVRELFKRAIDGESWSSMARWFREASGNPKSSHVAVKGMITNPAYLGWSGQTRSNGHINRKAHAPIVSQRVWDQANARKKGTKPSHDGSISSQCMLGGVPKCSQCGSTMSIAGSQGQPRYRCRAAGCTDHAVVSAKRLDEFVISRLFKLLSSNYTISFDLEDEDDSEEREALADAEHLREKFEDNKRTYMQAMTPEEFARELGELKAAVQEAEIALEMKSGKVMMPDPSLEIILASRPEDWDNTPLPIHHDALESILPSDWTEEQVAEWFKKPRPSVTYTGEFDEDGKGIATTERWFRLDEWWDAQTDESRREWLRSIIASLVISPTAGAQVPIEDRVTLTLETGE